MTRRHLEVASGAETESWLEASPADVDVAEEVGDSTVEAPHKRQKVASRDRLGPETWSDVFTFAEHVAQDLADFRASAGHDRHCLSIPHLIVTTAYSGIGTPEMSLPFIAQALSSIGPSETNRDIQITLSK